jgi:hypothetical protein
MEPKPAGDMTPIPSLAETTSAVLRQDFEQYGAWKGQIVEALGSLGNWLRREGPLSADARDRLGHSLRLVRDDRLTIAFVGEFSRGKTELINAIFFAGLGRRLLPSTAGRTTMCPTEILWDGADGEPYLRLLPIETRAKKTPIHQLKGEARNWVRFRLDPAAPLEVQTTLKRLTETKRLPLAEAQSLGFSAEDAANADPPGEVGVEVPCWRHALISFPHPLLQQGLVVLDTPGLNALGSEPELTLSTLPSAQAVLFVLAADTGVTRSDLEIWERHVQRAKQRTQALTVVLNKIDVLWDDLLDEDEIASEIAKQRASTARTLQLDPKHVFAVSAQKALLARVRQDPALLARSSLESLEEHLSSGLMHNKTALILDHLEIRLGNLVETHRERLNSRIQGLGTQAAELSGLGEKSKGVIGELIRRTRDEQRQHLRSLRQFESSHERLHTEARLSSRILGLQGLDDLIRTTQQEMLRKATTRGLSVAMKHLFDEMRRVMHTLTVECERLRRLSVFVYEYFEKHYGFTPVPPKGLGALGFRAELEALYEEAEAYRKSSRMMLAEQRFVVRRFFEVLVARVRQIFERFAADYRDWLDQALEPLHLQIEERKALMEQRLANLSSISRSKSALDGRLHELRHEQEVLARRLAELHEIDARRRLPPRSEHRAATAAPLASGPS